MPSFRRHDAKISSAVCLPLISSTFVCPPVCMTRMNGTPVGSWLIDVPSVLFEFVFAFVFVFVFVFAFVLMGLRVCGVWGSSGT